jgi:hypothetical protein
MEHYSKGSGGFNPYDLHHIAPSTLSTLSSHHAPPKESLPQQNKKADYLGHVCMPGPLFVACPEVLMSLPCPAVPALEPLLAWPELLSTPTGVPIDGLLQPRTTSALTSNSMPCVYTTGIELSPGQ